MASDAVEIPAELRDRLERVSRSARQFPYTFFDAEIQGTIHGGKSVGSKPVGYYPSISIQAAGAEVA
ncbi:hypothetical protein [Altericista sp. CCNU0014]|uniref:hypothetical protein n=1 Tax=Altericista sp. CCNU0014 TaxID=3082949 RepID=UPI00384BF81E